MGAKIKFTEEQLAYVKDSYTQGKTIRILADELGVNRDIIRARLHEMGVVLTGVGCYPLTPIIDGKKVCCRCNIPKLTTAFYTISDTQNRRYVMSYCKACYTKCKRAKTIRRKYGLLVEEYDAIWTKQGGVCALCLKPETRKIQGTLAVLTIDHDHNTGKVRGLLCTACNKAIGTLGDSIPAMQRVLDYMLGKL